MSERQTPVFDRLTRPISWKIKLTAGITALAYAAAFGLSLDTDDAPQPSGGIDKVFKSSAARPAANKPIQAELDMATYPLPQSWQPAVEVPTTITRPDKSTTSFVTQYATGHNAGGRTAVRMQLLDIQDGQPLVRPDNHPVPAIYLECLAAYPPGARYLTAVSNDDRLVALTGPLPSKACDDKRGFDATTLAGDAPDLTALSALLGELPRDSGVR